MARDPYLKIGFFGIFVWAVILGACNKGTDVGRRCFLENPEGDGGVPQTIVASPALECESRLCLHIAAQSPDLCTGTCATDSDCETDPASPCKGGFTCAIPVVTGAFCCQKLCMCRDELMLPDGGTIPTPAACDPANVANECCNLAGRRGDPKYPLCK